MGLNDTPSGERVHIGFFGRRNSGKSSLVNAVTGQEMSLVSDTLGTTTDPVSKAMELLPLGPVVIIDTPGFDDVGELGEQRVRRTRQILNRADMAVLVVDATVGLTAGDRQLVRIFEEKKLPYLIAANKCDLLGDSAPRQAGAAGAGVAAGQAVDTEREATSGLAGDTGRADELGRAVSAGQAANPGLSGDPERAVMPGQAEDSVRAVMPGS
jgi:small GTP-binding protein